MKIEKRLLKDLKPAEYNPRQSTEVQEQKLSESLKKFGCVEPIIINENQERKNIIIGGHFRVRELKKLGEKEVDCVIVNLNLEEERELNIRLNANTGEWDFDLLASGFDTLELDDWGLNLNLAENIDWASVDELNENNYKEPDKKLLRCPCCNHIDSADRFIAIKSEDLKEPKKITDYLIRLANEDDIDNIKKIADKYSKEIGFVLKPALIESANKKELLVAEYDNQILGFANFHRRKDGITTIYEICVNGEYRNNGIAKSLIKKIPAPIQLKCPVDNESNKFYEKIGFKLIKIEEGKNRKLNIWHINENIS